MSGKAYLAEHIKLKAKRVIKCVSKSQAMYQQFLSEATLLKNLKHPSIPIIYDLEEDEEYLYIIEEYIQGESLKAVMQNQKVISKETIIQFSIQICNIMEYLHNQKPYPVLYLDLKPDHIIVCNNSIKIIDFGAAIYMEKEEVDYSFGTPCFAAPEQFYSLKLDSKADIYAIGSILYFMLTGKNPSLFNEENLSLNNQIQIPTDFKKIMFRCMAKNPQDRYENVSQIIEELSICQDQTKTLIIGILGSQSRIGVSHIAIELVVFFNKNGIPAVLEENNKNGIVSYLNEFNNKMYQEDGIYKCKNFNAVPNYGETIFINKDKYKVVVKDFGSYEEVKQEFWTADIKIAVLGAKEWEIDKSEKCVDELLEHRIYYLFNLCEKNQAYKAAKQIGLKKSYRIPIITDPFTSTNVAEKIFKDIVREKIHVKKRKWFKK